MITGKTEIYQHSVSFTAADCNDGDWTMICNILHRLKDFKVYYGDGNNMTFEWKDEAKDENPKICNGHNEQE